MDEDLDLFEKLKLAEPTESEIEETVRRIQAGGEDGHRDLEAEKAALKASFLGRDQRVIAANIALIWNPLRGQNPCQVLQEQGVYDGHAEDVEKAQELYLIHLARERLKQALGG